MVKNLLNFHQSADLQHSRTLRNLPTTNKTDCEISPSASDLSPSISWQGEGSTAHYGHDGRSINLMEVILRQGGEGQAARDAFAGLTAQQQTRVIEFLNSLVLFPPDDTASTLDPGIRNALNFPQFGLEPEHRLIWLCFL